MHVLFFGINKKSSTKPSSEIKGLADYLCDRFFWTTTLMHLSSQLDAMQPNRFVL